MDDETLLKALFWCLLIPVSLAALTVALVWQAFNNGRPK